MIILPILLVLLGFLSLIKGADWLVEGASAIARRSGVPPLVVGLTIVAFGTSAPELAVSLLAVFSGSSDITIGNVIGSNIANILLILGITSIMVPIAVKSSTVWKEIPFVLLATLMLWVLVADAAFNSGRAGMIGRDDALILFGFFAIYLYYTFSLALSSREPKEVREEFAEAEPGKKAVRHSVRWNIGQIMFGLVGLVVGGQAVVTGASDIARSVGLPEVIIGITIVALGTSLPELVTCIVAAKKKEVDIIVGNVVGSNIFNIFLVLGLPALFRPIPFNTEQHIDMLVVFLSASILFIALFVVGRKYHITRRDGIGFLVFYAIYIGSLFTRL